MRLTTRGSGVLVLALVCVGVGIGIRLPELVAIGVGLGALLLLSVVAIAAGADVDVTPPTSLRVDRGSDSSVEVYLLDHGSRRLSGMRLRRRGGEGPDVVGLPLLKPGIPAAAAIPIPTSRRGPLVMGPWSVERVDAWLLVRREVTRVPAVEVVVVPRVYPLAMGSLPLGEGERNRSPQHGDDDVTSLREYVIGDEVRHIHWRSSAKAGNLMVKQHVAARRPGVHVVLDVAPHSYASDDEFEEAVDAAASLAVSAAQLGVVVDLTTTAGEWARAGSGRHAGVLDLLARVTPSSHAASPRSFDQGSAIGVTGSRGVGPASWRLVKLVRLGITTGDRGVIAAATAADLGTAMGGR